MSETEPATREELIQHLEKLSGRSLKTREDIRAYVREVAARQVSDDPKVRRWIKVKHITLAALLAFGVVQYYFLDVMLQIVTLQSPTFFVPVRATLKSMLVTLVG